jgi:hypothetical protein
MSKQTPTIIMALLCAAALHPWQAGAGGGPANVAVLYNGDSTDASDVALAYAQARSIPGGQLCPLAGIDPAQTEIAFDQYDTLIHAPFRTCLEAMPQPDEIDYVVLVRGLPYKVNLSGYSASLEAVLQVHDAECSGTPIAGSPQENSGSYYEPSFHNPAYIEGFPYPGDYTISNPYQTWYTAAPAIVRAASLPASFRRMSAGSAGGCTFDGNLFIVSRLDGFDFDDARALVERAVAADGSFPTSTLLCMASSDEPRGARDPECEFVARHLAMAGLSGEFLTPFDGALSGRTLSACFTGTADLRGAIAGNVYDPGALACNLTSFGAAPSNFFCSADGTACPQSESQTSIARFIRAGATGAHGTVNEPLNHCFPNAGTLLLYTFGYNMGESFFMNQRFLYWQNIYLGDPLTTPYARRPGVTLGSTGEIARGSALEVEATHPDGIAGLALYLDGVLVDETDTDTLSYAIDDPPGTEIDVLAVAVAANAIVRREGWPNPDQQPSPDVQGWRSATITVTPPGSDPEPDGGEDAAETAEPSEDAHLDVPVDPASEADPSEPAADGASDTGAEEDGGGKNGCGCSLAG